jgi:hypothetical protein
MVWGLAVVALVCTKRMMSGSAIRRLAGKMRTMAEVKQEIGWRARLDVTNDALFSKWVPKWHWSPAQLADVIAVRLQ